MRSINRRPHASSRNDGNLNRHRSVNSGIIMYAISTDARRRGVLGRSNSGAITSNGVMNVRVAVTRIRVAIVVPKA